MKKTLGLLAFDGMEVLDFAGPFEVFTVADELRSGDLLQVCTLGYRTQSIRCWNGLKLVADDIFPDAPLFDILVLPGGNGTRALMQDEELLNWLQRHVATGRFILSVCSGALLLGKAGLLDCQDATTHHEVLKELAQVAPTARLKKDERFCDNGQIITSAGIAAGIDASLHFVRREWGDELGQQVRRYMEY